MTDEELHLLQLLSFHDEISSSVGHGIKEQVNTKMDQRVIPELNSKFEKRTPELWQLSVESEPKRKDTVFDNNPENSSDIGNENENDNDNVFVCSICMEPTRHNEPVVTQCGHLYCWPCLYRWIHTGRKTCPVCKSGVTEDSVIPIFIKGVESGSTQRQQGTGDGGDEQIPPRPTGHRQEAPLSPEELANNAPPIEVGYSSGGLLSFSGSLGVFPAGIIDEFARFTWEIPADESEDETKQRFMMRLLLVLGVSIIACLLLL